MKSIDKSMKVSGKAIEKEIKKAIKEEILCSIRGSRNASTKTCYNNIALLDLRHITTIEAVAEIEEIRNVAVLILPSVSTPEFQKAWTRVGMTNIAKTIYIEESDEFIIHNGTSEMNLSSTGTARRIVYMLNGTGIIFGEPNKDKIIELIVNGLVIIQSSLVELPKLKIDANGKVIYVDFEKFNTVQDKTISVSHIENIEKNTLIICQNKDSVKIDKTVTEQKLKDKNIKFVFFGKGYKCSKELRGYMSINSSLVNSWYYE